MKTINNFRTTEYYLAATLLVLNETLVDIERKEESQRATFVFAESPTIEKNIEDFRRGSLLVEPNALFLQHKSLKSRLYNN